MRRRNPRERQPRYVSPTPKWRKLTVLKGRLNASGGSIHGPKKPRGFTTIRENQDRQAKAVVGQPDPSLLVLTFNCEKEVKPGVVIRGPAFSYKFEDILPDFDWSNKDHITHLNGWRQQIMVRQFGAMRATRYQYTVAEQNVIVRILSAHLKTPEVAGRYKLIDWKHVADKLNDEFRDHYFPDKEPVAQTHYPKANDGWVHSNARKTVPPHTYIEREPSGIANQ